MLSTAAGVVSSPARPTTFLGRSIPSLDGIRCVAILFVIVHHALSSDALQNFPWLRAVVNDGELGVNLFFVLSGFLCTTLLMREQERRGGIDVQGFYRRRLRRLLPAFYLYIAVLLGLSLAGLVGVNRWNLAFAALGIYNYLSLSGGTPEIGHAWSLSAEWQFYLIWPWLLTAVKNPRRWVWGLIAAEPFVRGITYFTPGRGRMGMMLHTQADLLLWGCALALYWQSPAVAALARRFCRPVWMAGVAAFLVFVSPVLAIYGRGAYTMLIGRTVTGPLVALLLLWVVREPGTLVGRMLNWKPVAWVGLISYSLYLWQQLLIWEADQSGLLGFAWRLGGLLLVATASFYLVEQRRGRAPARAMSMVAGPQ